jgi:hypothetical protein
VPGSGTGVSGTPGPVASTGPVFPFVPRMSATKTFAKLFGAVRSAIVALRTVKLTAPPNPVGPLPHVGQLIPNVKFPVPSPFRAPVAATRAGTWGSTTMSPKATGTAVFGDWSGVLLATFGILEIGVNVADAGSVLFKTGAAGVRVLWSVDAACVRPESFCSMTSIS